MTIEIKVPAIGESISEVTMGSWLKENGAFVDEDDVICEVESEKATVEITAEKAGSLAHKAQEGDTIAVGGVLAEINTDAEKPAESSTEAAETAADQDEKAGTPKPVEEQAVVQNGTKMTPVASNILENAGIRGDAVKGTGSGGRVTKADALKHLENSESAGQEQKEKPVPVSDENNRSVRRVRMTTLRRTISERLLAAKHGTAMLTTINEIDLSEVKKIRARYKDMFKEKYDVGLGFMSFFTKAVCTALEEFPEVNARIEDNEILYHDFCDISIAISTDRGLVVPVIRNAERMNLAQIESEVARLALKARDNKLTIEEMTGGTFSLTNGGVFGSLISTPIINAPQSAILGMHTIQDRPVVRGGEIVVRPMMYVALSYDHRIIDGKESVSFLVRVKDLLEDPVRLLVGV